MKSSLLILTAALGFGWCQLALAEAKEEPKTSVKSADSGAVTQMSDVPIMQEQGKRMAALMEKIKEVTDPAERKRLLAEAVCPQ